MLYLEMEKHMFRSNVSAMERFQLPSVRVATGKQWSHVCL